MTVRDLGQVPVEVGLQDEAGTPHAGVLDYAAPEIDGDTGTLAVRGLLANPGRVLLVGYFVHVRIPVQRDVAALAIPEASIGMDQDGPVVFTVGADGLVSPRHVRTGEMQDGLRVVEQGLAPADRVILSGRQRIAPGDRVAAHPAASG